ncbi:MAG: hypothetical protein ACYC4U_08670 [Pirellulaceae bacterium]
MVTLEELIARQRFSLNRSTQASKIANDAQQPDAATAVQWADFEKTSAEATQELAESLERCSGQPLPMLHDARKEMLAAADDLAGRKFEPCAGHDREALTNLIKARNTVYQFLTKPNPANGQEVRDFDRKQAQKLRRPKEKDEKQEAEQLPERLRQLAKQEEFVYATAAKPPEERDQVTKSKATSSEGSASGKSAGKSSATNEPSTDSPRDNQQRQDRPSQEPGKETSQSPVSEGGEGEQQKDLEKLQSEVVDEARAIEQMMSRLAAQNEGRAISELARSRMNEAVKKAEDVAGSIFRGNRSETAKTAKDAAGMFFELAVHVEGLLGREAAQRLAAARDLASNLAQREQDLADRLDRDAPPGTRPGSTAPADSGELKDREKPSGSGSGRTSSKSSQSSPKGEGPSTKGENSQDNSNSGTAGPDALDKAAQVAESGRTLEDLLRMLAPDDEAQNIGPETVERIEKLVREADAGTLISRMREVEGMLRAGRVAGSQIEARQLAERLEVLAQRLDVLHRAVITPQLESLIALERRAAELRERFGKLDSQAAISRWHRDADLLLQEFSRLKDRSVSAERLAEVMRVEGWGTHVTHWDWNRVGGHHIGPAAYDVSMTALAAELREEVREFMLRELVAASDEPTPPQYKELVERYFQVLSQQGSGAEGRRTPE